MVRGAPSRAHLPFSHDIVAVRVPSEPASATAFCDRVVARVGRLRPGPGLDLSHHLGCLVSTAAQLDRVHRHVEGAVERGAAVLSGTRARPDLGPLFYEPTVLTDVPAGALCTCEETFAPVVTVRRVGGHDEAVGRGGSGIGRRFALGGRRFSTTFTTALRASRRTHLPWP